MAYIAESTMLNAESIEKLQADIVSIDTSKNSAITSIHRNNLPAKRYALIAELAKYTRIGPAINALGYSQNSLNQNVKNSLDTIYSVIGNFSTDGSLLERLNNYSSETFTATEHSLIEIVLDLANRLNKVEKLAADDYEDIFTVPDGATQDKFILSHKPIGKIRFYIDGVRYFSECYSYDVDTNTVTWLATKALEGTNGFDISDSIVTIEYDYDVNETTTNV